MAKTAEAGRSEFQPVAEGRLDRPASRIWHGVSSLSYFQLVFAAYVAITLSIFTFFVPPLQKSDEPAHFHRAVSITNGDVVCDKDSDGNYFFMMKRKYAELPEVLRTFETAFRYESKFDSDLFRYVYSDPRYETEARIERFCSLPVPGYLPNAFGVLLGKPFQNPLVSLYSGRLFGALFFVICLVIALRVVPDRYRLIVYFYAALPTLLHQVSAVSYDAVQLSLFPVIFAYLTRFLVAEGRVRPSQLLIFMALLWWIINIRLLAYYPLLLLFFVIPSAKIEPRFSRYLMISAAFLGFSIVTTGLFDLIYVPRATDSIPPGLDIDASAQVRFVLAHPWHFAAVAYKTLHLNGGGYLREVIGVFGWLDYTFNWLPYYAVIFVAGIVFYYHAQRDAAMLRLGQLIVLCAAVALTAGSLFFSLYAVWTPVRADIIGGIQGRYFSGLLPFTIFAASQTAVIVGRARLLKALLLILVVVLLYNIFRAIDLRYY